MKKYISFLIIFSVLIIGFLFLFKSSKKPQLEKKEETVQNWQLYENSAHGFSFSYPKDWEFKVINETTETLSLNLKKEDQTQDKIDVYNEEITPNYTISISVEKNPNNFLAKELYLSNFSESSRAEAETKIQEMTISGQPAIQYPEGVAPASGPAKAILVTLNNKAYRFIYSALATEETHEKYLEVFNKLLTTIKFI